MTRLVGFDLALPPLLVIPALVTVLALLATALRWPLTPPSPSVRI